MKISYAQAINKALKEEMMRNKKLVCFGLGASDSLKFFGTTKGLKEKFGEQRVFETPTSENAMTGIGIGMSLYKNPCIMIIFSMSIEVEVRICWFAICITRPSSQHRQ